MQQTDSKGQVTFKTIFPGRYTGRVNHIHMEVFSGSSLSTRSKVLVTQFAFPDDVDTTVDSYYKNTNSASLTNFRDQVFASNYQELMFSVSGSVSAAYTATATAGVSL